MLKIRKKFDIDLENTICCGQIFRYNILDDNSYDVILSDRVINIKEDKDYLIVDSNNMDNLEEVIIKYFDLDRDYSEIYNNINLDKNIINYNKGLKIIKQEPLECLISYIISQNNSVSNITNSLNLISKKCGKKVVFNEKEYYLFPTLDELKKLTLNDFRECKVGFRDKYLVGIIKEINNTLNLDLIYDMNDIEAIDYLTYYKGIGLKVASCILLFAYHKFSVYPIDTWVIKYMDENYNIKTKEDIKKYFYTNYKKYSGIVIQYIFNYNRNK